MAWVEIASIGTAAGVVVALGTGILGWRAAAAANRTAEKALAEARRSNDTAERALAIQQAQLAMEQATRQATIVIEKVSGRSNQGSITATCTLRNVGGSSGTLTGLQISQGDQEAIVGTSGAEVVLAPGEQKDVHFDLTPAVPPEWQWSRSGCTVRATLMDPQGPRTIAIPKPSSK